MKRVLTLIVFLASLLLVAPASPASSSLADGVPRCCF
jgi:hypothetical protein